MISQTPTAIRSALHDAVLRDLLGPAGGPDEIVDEQNVRGRYVLGLLAPRGQTAVPFGSDDPDAIEDTVAPEENDDLAEAGRDSEDGKAEARAPKAASMLPSSIGMTFTVDPNARAIQLAASWGRYEKVKREEAGLPVDDSDKRARDPWQRIAVRGVSQPIALVDGPIKRWEPDSRYPEVYVAGRIRRYAHGWTVTVYLVNGQTEPARNKDSAWVFQPELSVADPDGAPIFVRHLPSRVRRMSEWPLEEQTMQMLYRQQVEFAVGHNTAVHAEPATNLTLPAAVRISTTVAPAYELWPTRPTALSGAQFGMRALANLPDDGFAPALQPLFDAYAAWIAAREAELVSPAADLQPYLEPAKVAIDNCKRALARMREGLDTLARDPLAAQAFRFANDAMYRQRLHTLYAQEVRRNPEVGPIEQFVLDPEPAWRPFQIAFVLVNLASLSDPLHPEREDVADVLWFPTGGGKTEAYLGLTAFTLGLRRLQGKMDDYDGSAGVTVLMRYTLRLLTLQQFQRATALICACEEIRQEAQERGDGRWGEEPFRIGLWVGQRSTPNTVKGSAEAVKDYRQGRRPSSSSPHQLTTCPWCGSPINPGQDIEVETYEQGRARTLVYCSDTGGACRYSRKRAAGEGLPVIVVDEEIYRRLPSLLIATVDKFAQLPWKGETQMLFGKINGHCSRHGFRSPEIEDANTHPRKGNHPPASTTPRGPLRPPDLIIQDELHLINGPLGTLVGLYETTIDMLSTWTYKGKPVKPKVIASSATIRRANEQVQHLYTRQAQIFPPSGLDARDSFFARQTEPTEDAPGRLYIGLCAPGTRMRALLIRAYVAYLSAAQQLYEERGLGKAADPWMTLVGYFNSIRELGGMRRAVEDAVTARLSQASLRDKRGLAVRRLNLQRSIEELTSRKNATDIPDILDRLESQFDPAASDQRKARLKAGERTDFKQNPIDVLLATNMISVGVDVARLGLMVVASQPKNTAEYIQATSRIGRSHPGLVCTVFNWARPRDLSHYERFEQYHATFYQQVEALSVTPFSARALDRALTALLVAAIRLQGDAYNANDGAMRLERTHAFVTQAVDAIVRRAERVTQDSAVAADVRARLMTTLDDWLARAQRQRGTGGLIGYESSRDGRTVGLLQRPQSQAAQQWDRFACLMSLRDVEPGIKLVMTDERLDP